MRVGLAACALGAAGMFVAPAAAQETGTLITHRAARIDEGNPNAGRIAMEQFAACIVSRTKGSVLKLVGMLADTPEYNKYLRGLFDREDRCLSAGQLSFQYMTFRGALFQALYAADFKSDGPTDFPATASTGYRELYGETLSPEARASVALEQFGECVARVDGSSVRSLLHAVTGSSQETAMFIALGPRFGACIPKGETISFSKTILKGALAEGLYRLSEAAAGQQATR